MDMDMETDMDMNKDKDNGKDKDNNRGRDNVYYLGHEQFFIQIKR
jgi:hypothetical protein